MALSPCFALDAQARQARAATALWEEGAICAPHNEALGDPYALSAKYTPLPKQGTANLESKDCYETALEVPRVVSLLLRDPWAS